MTQISARAWLAGFVLAACAMPALAADYGAGQATDNSGNEVRRYYMDTGRAYGAPVTYYARITPAPPSRFIYLEGVRGPARIELDDRPSFPGPDWIKLIE